MLIIITGEIVIFHHQNMIVSDSSSNFSWDQLYHDHSVWEHLAVHGYLHNRRSLIHLHKIKSHQPGSVRQIRQEKKPHSNSAA